MEAAADQSLAANHAGSGHGALCLARRSSADLFLFVIPDRAAPTLNGAIEIAADERSHRKGHIMAIGLQGQSFNTIARSIS
jgi:hypothetical protein